MSFLAQHSAAGLPVSTGKTKVKHVIFEIFAGVTCSYKAIDYKNAVLGLLTGQQMSKTRTNPDGDKRLDGSSASLLKIHHIIHHVKPNFYHVCLAELPFSMKRRTLQRISLHSGTLMPLMKLPNFMDAGFCSFSRTMQRQWRKPLKCSLRHVWFPKQPDGKSMRQAVSYAGWQRWPSDHHGKKKC